ncbi:Perfringolysin, partial [Basidiobolus meristosporus CBS 931.73]
TPKELVTFSTILDAFWPGALLQGKGYVGGVGGFKLLPIWERNDQKITVDFMNGKSTSVICKPDSGKVRNVIASLVSKAKFSGHEAGANIHYRTVEGNSAESAALNLVFGTSHLTHQAKTTLDAQRNYTERTVSVYFVERAYTVDIMMPKTSADFFNNRFTIEDLKERVRFGRLGPYNLRVFVSSVSYGCALFYSVTSSAIAPDIRATIQSSYNGLMLGVDFHPNIKHQKPLSESKIGVAMMGGSRNAAINLIHDGNLYSFFSHESSLETCMPISYTMRSVANGNLAAVSQTTKYTIKSCHPVHKGYKWIFKTISLTLMGPSEPGNDDTAEAWGDIVLNGQYIWSVEKSRYQSIKVGQNVNFFKPPRATVLTDLSDDISPPFSLYLNFIDDDTWNGDFDGTIVNGNFTEWEVGTHTMRLRSEGELLLSYKVNKEKYGMLLN